MVSRKLNEAARLGVLAVVAAWLLHPFATGSRYGGGDALWYAHMLADYVAQIRAGVFPVFAGQTEFAFNGAVYPLRVAPLYQHLAGLLDLLTLHSLGVFALQHLTVIVCGTAGILASYLSLCWIAPGRRWAAVGFSVLYLSCPGVLATIYTQDLYMTWMTVALAPFATYGIVRTFRSDDLRSQLILGASQAALWWAHSPIAMWFAFVAAGSQVARLAGLREGPGPFVRAVAGALVFLVLAQYPFVSVATLGAAGGHASVAAPLAHAELIAGNIRDVFPAVLLPLGVNPSGLAGLQLGYGLWGVLLAAAVIAVTGRRLDLAVLLAAAVLLLFLLLPLRGVNAPLWASMPQAVLRITYYWPMQRFYLILAALLAPAGQIAWDTARLERHRSVAAVLLAACCLWSLQQANAFMGLARAGTVDSAASARSLRPENTFLMNHAYGMFDGLPPHFSNGVVDPRSEARLIPAGPAQNGERWAASGLLTGTVDDNPGILDLAPPMHLDPGHRYRLGLVFAHAEVPGILQCVGRSMFREYRLPSSGERLSFGSAPPNTPDMDLWTTDSAGDDVSLRFIPDQPGPDPEALTEFGSFQLSELLPAQQGVEVESLMPFRARTRAGSPAVLETPRVFIPGYDAWVDGQQVGVIRSPDFLVGVPVPSGEHTVAVAYSGPPRLRISYWAALLAWAATLWVLAAGRRPLRNLSAPAQ